MKKVTTRILAAGLLLGLVSASHAWMPKFIVQDNGTIYVDADGVVNMKTLSVATDEHVGNDGAAVTIHSTLANVPGTAYLLRLLYDADGDPQGDFLVCEDNTGTNKFVVGAEGNIQVKGTLDVTGVFEAVASSGVVVGSGGSRNYIDGVGDLYVQDELEVDGGAQITGVLKSNTQFQTGPAVIVQGNFQFGDADSGEYMVFSDSLRSTLGYDESRDLLVISGSSSINTDPVFEIDATSTTIKNAVHATGMKSGVDQAGAGAVAGEMYRDTDDDNTIKLGV